MTVHSPLPALGFVFLLNIQECYPVFVYLLESELHWCQTSLQSELDHSDYIFRICSVSTLFVSGVLFPFDVTVLAAQRSSGQI